MAETWLVEFEVEDAKASKRRLFEVPAGAWLDVGGAGSVVRSEAPLFSVFVRDDGRLDARRAAQAVTLDGAAFEQAELQVGSVLQSPGVATLTVAVAPRLKGLTAPPATARWKIDAQVEHAGKVTPFQFVRPTGLVFSLGRIDLNAMRVAVDELARRHAGFFVDARGELWAGDLGTTPGTWVGQQRLSGWVRASSVRAGPVTVSLTAAPA